MAENRQLSKALIIIMLSVGAWGTSAQETLTEEGTGRTLYLRYFVGAYAALGINLHNASFGALPGVPSCCTEYRDATALVPVIAGLFEIPIMRDLRFQSRLGFTTMSGTLKRQEDIGNEPVLSDGPLPTQERRDIEVEHSLSASLPMVVLEPTMAYRVLQFFWLTGGLRGGYVMNSSYDQAETLFSPDGYTFLDGSAIRNQYAGAIPDQQPLQMHAVLGLSYELLTKGRISIVPEVRYYIPLTKVSSVDWSVSSFQLGASLRYGVYTPKDPQIIRDTVISRDTVIVEKPNLRGDQVFLSKREYEDSVRNEADFRYITTWVRESYVRETPRPFAPEIALTFETVDPAGQMRRVDTVRVEELDVIENYPLLPQVFFTRGNSSLDSTSQILLDQDQAKDFRTMDLSRDQIDVYRNLLNVIGHRLSRNPSAVITVTGCTDNLDEEKNNRELAQRRAEAVRDYLTASYRLEQSQVKVQWRLLPASPANPVTADGQAENRRVEITSNDPSILEPVEFKDKDLIVSPQSLTVKPSVTGGQDIATWDASIRQGANKLVESKGEGRPTPINWDAANGARPKNNKPVVASVTVRNEIGQEKTVSDTIDVDYVTVQLMKSREEGGKLIERYSLIVFEFNSAQLSAENQRVMDRVKSRIQPESKVRIVGYADRQGNAEYNRNLARKRCVEAQRVLGLPDGRVTIEPVGSERLLFDNDTPEGRSYSRTVQIEIETPVR